MPYKIVSDVDLSQHLSSLLMGQVESLAHLAHDAATGASTDTGALVSAVEEIAQKLEERRVAAEPDLDDDQFEGRMAGILHEGLNSWGISALDDSDFWTYLASGPLWFFTRWRENPGERKHEVYYKYLSGRYPAMCVPLRMYLRAQAIELEGDYTLASSVPDGTDFWRSHVLRVRTGGSVELARALAQSQADDRLTVLPLRALARRINGRWSNEVLDVLDSNECERIIDQERRTAT